MTTDIVVIVNIIGPMAKRCIVANYSTESLLPERTVADISKKIKSSEYEIIKDRKI